MKEIRNDVIHSNMKVTKEKLKEYVNAMTLLLGFIPKDKSYSPSVKEAINYIKEVSIYILTFKV